MQEWMRLTVETLEGQFCEDQDDYEALIELLVEVREWRRQLGDLEREIEGAAIEHLPARKVDVVGVGVVELRTGAKRKKWDSEALVSRLVRDALYDPATGEARHASVAESVDAAVAAVTACAPFTGSMGWRAGALRDHGIDPDEWCESAPGRKTIQIHGEG